MEELVRITLDRYRSHYNNIDPGTINVNEAKQTVTFTNTNGVEITSELPYQTIPMSQVSKKPESSPEMVSKTDIPGGTLDGMLDGE